MAQFQLDKKAAEQWLTKSEHAWQQEVQAAHDKVHNLTGAGSDFLGWLDPLSPDGNEGEPS